MEKASYKDLAHKFLLPLILQSIKVESRKNGHIIDWKWKHLLPSTAVFASSQEILEPQPIEKLFPLF